MNYEKKYKEAVNKIRDLLDDGEKNGFTIVTYKTDLESIFPELAGSEDEKVRKEIVEYLKKNLRLEWATWLEKQGEKEPTIEMKTPEESLGIDSDTYNKIVNECIYGEQKPQRMISAEAKEAMYDKPADKVEPKFKVGGWIVFNGITLYIKEVVKGYYRTISKGGITNSYDWGIDNVARLWTIQDAKPGDVLATEPIDSYPFPFVAIYENRGLDFFNSYCFIGFDGKFYQAGTGHSIENIHPATNEQCDTLMKAMADAGYTFDFDKRELKKIEQKSVEWGEEDEEMLRSIIATCELAEADRDSSPARHLLEMQLNWLKSLRPQNHWKPSDEQMKVLISEVEGWTNGCPKQKVLESLYNDLKNLK